MHDKWEFKKSNLRKWHWQRISPTGDVVGSSPRGYSRRVDCEENAHSNGWLKVDITEQQLIEGENINQETQLSTEEGSPLENAASAPGYISDKNYRVKRDSRQRMMMVLIASFLGLILIATLLILFKQDQQVGVSDINRLTTGRGHDAPVINRVSQDVVSLWTMSGLSPLI